MIPILLASAAALATGYGSVDEDGYPSWAERDLHLWTNAVRVDPEAFDADFGQGGCSFDDFSASEQTAHAPLYYDRNLNLAGRYHSDDMYSNGWFDHDSSDGTSFSARMANFYPDSGYVGENIAYGYPDTYIVVMQGWMCSSGHRANIMGDYNELGVGVVSTYYTQDFGAGTVDVDAPVAMGTHQPAEPTDTASFYADWQDDEAPARLAVVLDGDDADLALVWGEEAQGVYGVDLDAPGGDCHEYYFAWERADGTSGTFPEVGSYLYGSGCDEPRMWIDSQGGGGSDGDPGFDIRLVGCSAAGGAAPGWQWLLAAAGVALVGRRRRR
jgi:MYXO-CTERM domain-containing protein